MNKILGLLVGSVGLAASAHAATLTYQFSHANPLETTEIAQRGTLGLFDSDLGTLMGATLTLTGAMSQALSITNMAAQAQTLVASTTIDLAFVSSLVPLNDYLSQGGPQVVLTASTGPLTVASGATHASGPMGSSNRLVIDLSPWLDHFVQAGGGEFNVDCSSLSTLGVRGGGGNLFVDQTTQAQCGATILYSFGPSGSTLNATVPEPWGPGLVGIALAAAGWARRRRG